MGFCKGLGKNYLIALNTVVACCGIAVAGCFGYAQASYDDFSALFSENGVLIGIACGALVFLCGLIGCCGAMKQNKCLLTIYSLGMMLLILAELAIGASVLLYLGYMDDVSHETVGQIEHELTQAINDYELAAWTNCCYDSYSRDDGVDWSPVMQCFPDLDDQLACYYDGDKWDSLYIEWAKPSVCQGLQELKLANGDALVGSPLGTTSCGGNAESGPAAQEAFQQNINDWFSDHAMPLGIGACVITVIQLFALIFSCCLLCENRAEYDDEYAKKLQEQEMAAGNLSGTAPPAGYSKPSEYV